jgi:DNA-binding CsgD family transcriptional regulator
VILAASRGEITGPYNLLSQTKNGTMILLNVSVIVPPDPDSPLAIIHLFRDITQQLYYEIYVEQILSAAIRLPLPLNVAGHHALRKSQLPIPLTGREKEVLYLLIQGKAPREIATTLSLSYATVRNHLQNTLRKLGAHNQRELVKLALERHLV